MVRRNLCEKAAAESLEAVLEDDEDGFWEPPPRLCPACGVEPHFDWRGNHIVCDCGEG